MRSASSRISTWIGAQVKYPLLVEIDQAAGRADQDIDTLLEVVALLVVVDAAECEAEREARVLPEDLGVVVDLHGEFARRRNDQRTRCIRQPVYRHLASHQRGVHRDQECGGLAGAGLGLPCDIHARECARQSLRLDGGATLESGIGDASGERVRQVEVGERYVGQVVCQTSRKLVHAALQIGKKRVQITLISGSIRSRQISSPANRALARFPLSGVSGATEFLQTPVIGQPFPIVCPTRTPPSPDSGTDPSLTRGKPTTSVSSSPIYQRR